MRFLFHAYFICVSAAVEIQEDDYLGADLIAAESVESRKELRSGNIDTEEERQLAGNDARSNIAEMILAAQKIKVKDQDTQNTKEMSLKALFPEANIRIGGDRPLVRQAVTTEGTTAKQNIATTTQLSTTTELTTTEPTTTTTENTASIPKSGDLELMVEDIVHTGHMIHWSVEQKYLAISDLWGQKYLRFAENPPPTTTALPSSTDTIRDSRQDNSEDITTATQSTAPTEPTTTAEPLPYDLKTLNIPKDTVFLIRPQETTEGTYPLMVPVHDQYNYTDNTDEVILAFNERFHLVSWDMEAEEMNVSSAQWFNAQSSGIEIKDFMIPSAAWVDPFGQLFVGTHDIRPFQKVVVNSIFSFFPNSFESIETFNELSSISCDPTGMAWGLDNATLFFADGHTKNITKCIYDYKKADVANCETILNVAEEVSESATPGGMAVDENDHVWVALADEDKGAVIEIDPVTNTIISTIEVEDPELVDIVFAGEDLDFLFVLSKKSLYKMTGMGVKGRHVPDFIWKPELRK